METLEQVIETPFEFKRRISKEFQQTLDNNFPGAFKIKILRKDVELNTEFEEWVDACVEIACDYIGVTKEEILGRSRRLPLPEFRWMIVAYIYDVKYLHIEAFKLKRQLMRYFNRDHAMFVHCVEVHNNLIETDKKYSTTYFKLKDYLNSQMI